MYVHKGAMHSNALVMDDHSDVLMNPVEICHVYSGAPHALAVLEDSVALNLMLCACCVACLCPPHLAPLQALCWQPAGPERRLGQPRIVFP